MTYLHKSSFKSHGGLTSGTCYIDNRWVLKVGCVVLSAFGPADDREEDPNSEHLYSKMFWTAPEILRMKVKPVYGTQKGDVYSFAIISQEIVYRVSPYCEEVLPPKGESSH